VGTSSVAKGTDCEDNEKPMGLVTTAHSMSLNGFIADTDYLGDRLQRWLQAGDTQSRLNGTSLLVELLCFG
jgi:hypothetical protein